MNHINDWTLKEEVRQYWNEHPCGTQFTDLAWGSREFFERVEKFRYQTQPFMNELIGFDKYYGKKLLEVGCGLGTDLIQFARHGALVTGIDLTPNSVDLVKKRFAIENLPVDARVADAENLPFGDASFDVVYSFGVLHHTPDIRKAIGEIYRVLKPNGQVIIMLYNKNSLHVWLGAPFYALSRIFWANRIVRLSELLGEWVRIYDGADNPLGRAYSRKEIDKLFEKFTSREYAICDSYRRRFPDLINEINQVFLAPILGFWIIVKAKK